MPIQPARKYRPPAYFFSAHLETIYPYLFRKVNGVHYERERIELPDGDFLDLDWSTSNHDRLLVLCHGLEGSSQSQYMLGMAKAALRREWDVVCVNFRSCSGEMNRKLRMYHHGETGDLTHILDLIIDRGKYNIISLCGFSLGGNVIVKYLGTRGNQTPTEIRSAGVISVPADLASSSRALDKRKNYFYTRRFMKSLKPKFEHKSFQFPGTIDMTGYDAANSWRIFDNTYTTIVTGFKNAAEYYRQGSARFFIEGVMTNTLILNAVNDPFLQGPSYPVDLCTESNFVFLETPRYGGHVGFWYPGRAESYAEERIMEFLSNSQS